MPALHLQPEPDVLTTAIPFTKAQVAAAITPIAAVTKYTLTDLIAIAYKKSLVQNQAFFILHTNNLTTIKLIARLYPGNGRWSLLAFVL
jgi:hypothetical protein